MSLGVPSPDELAIAHRLHHLVTQCSRGLDRGDTQLVRDCFHAGADVPTIDGNSDGGGTTQHVVTNHLLLGIRGDVAATETYWQHRAIGGDGALVESFGRYLDRFERRAGQWRIAQRVTITDSTPGAERGEPDPSFALAAEVEPEGAHGGGVHVDGVVA